MWPSQFDTEDAMIALAQLQGGLAFGSIVGKTLWVDSAQTTSQEAGTYLEPFLTIEAAISDPQCVTSRGDVILVKPTHEEDLDSSGALIDLDKHGIAVIGLGQAQFRPKLTFSDAGAYLEVAAAGCRIANIWFHNAVNTLAKFVNVDAAGDGLRLENCLFTTESTAYEATNFVVLGQAEDVSLIGNTFAFDGVDAGDSGIVAASCMLRLAIINNIINGNFGSGMAIEITGAACRSLFIARNHIYAAQNVAGGAIYVDDGTGHIVNNRGYCANASAINNDDCEAAENYFTSSLSASGTLDP